MAERPTGVTVLAVLCVIGGLLALLFGGLFTFMGPAITAEMAATDEALGMATGPMVMGLGIFALVMGVLYLITAYGLFALKPWAWMVAVVVQVLTLVSHGFSIFQGQLAGAVVGILIAGGILYYLLRPHVKAAFGRS
jgi:uncharacterized membrane protein (DUF2068 family)